jgi:hypothetical protein
MRSRFPKRPRLSQFCYVGEKLLQILFAVGNIIGVEPPAEEIAGEYFQQARQGEDTLLRSGIKLRPVFDVLFRPEEIHGASGMR